MSANTKAAKKANVNSSSTEVKKTVEVVVTDAVPEAVKTLVEKSKNKKSLDMESHTNGVMSTPESHTNGVLADGDVVATPTTTVHKNGVKATAKKSAAKKSTKSDSAEVKEELTTSTPVEDTAGDAVVAKKLTVAKGTVVLKTVEKSPRSRAATTKKPAPKKAASRSPKRPAAKSPAKGSSRSPAKVVAKLPTKTASKSPVAKKSVTTAKAKTNKRTVKKTGGKKVVKAARPHNTKPAPIDFMGIGIGPAKAKKVLLHTAFNPEEYSVRQELIKAENKPVRPKPTEQDPDPALPKQGAQTPVDQLPEEYLAVIRAAEAAHEQNLYEEYERETVRTMSEEDRAAYYTAKKAAYDATEDANNFNLRAFNLAYNKSFYDGFAAYCKVKDRYAINRVVKDKDGNDHERYNQWTRAAALVNKSCIRLSKGVRDILACFLDNLVVQYAHNGTVNCIAEDYSNLKPQHALKPSAGFEERVPLDAFARTLSGYQLALSWIESCRETQDELAETRRKIKKGELEGEAVADYPDYPDPQYDENFGGYVPDICRSVRMKLADEQKSAADKAKYHNIKTSDHFKKFCSIIIYESILRIGAHLKEVVALKSVKTVSADLMYHTLKQLCNICGVDFAPIQRDMKARLDKFNKQCNDRLESRRAQRSGAVDEDADNASDDEDDGVEEGNEAEEENADEENANAEDDSNEVPDDAEEVAVPEDSNTADVTVEYEEEQ